MDHDDRFKHITTDPKFRRIPKSERKIKIDKRFKSMFKDEKFKLKYTIDKRGRPVNHSTTEDLKRYYDLSTDSEKSAESSEEEESEAGTFVRAPKEIANEFDKKETDDGPIPDKVKKKLKNLKVDYARGEGDLISDSSSSDDDDIADDLNDTEDSDDSVDHAWGELDKDADKTDEVTNRLAVCNQDWDRIRAVDLIVLFTSFVPAGGVINSVSIYPSNFGLQRMQEEDSKGPTELLAMKKEYSDEEETEEGSKYHMEKLRQYQLNRLKYYYAVIVCDSLETANKLYTECDGLEYESSATKIDLRFIPDTTEFENTPKEVCDKIPERYQPRFFTTTALQQAKVELTWDETNPARLEVAKMLTSGKIDDVTDQDLQNYLASSSGEETDDEKTGSFQNNDSKNPIDKYRALLQDIEQAEQDKKEDVQMEITWGLNLKEKAEKLVKKKLEDKEEKTPFQEFLNKRKEKRKSKREERKKHTKDDISNSDESDIPSDIDMNDSYFAEEFNNAEFKKHPKQKATEESKGTKKQDTAELELLLLNENEDNKKHFSMQKIQEQEKGGKKNRKKKKKQLLEERNKLEEDNFKVNVKDDRFSALYSSHHYNIDPTDPNYRKTRGMEAIVVEKLKRRNDDDLRSKDNAAEAEKRPKLEKKAELNVLVKSIKRKTEAMKKGKKY